MKCCRCDDEAIKGEALCPIHAIVAEREYVQGRREIEEYRKKK